MTIEELNKDFKNLGFEIKEDIYTLDKVTYQQVSINGRIFQQPQHHMFKMKYIGEGYEVDDSDERIENTEFHEFDILDDEGDSNLTLCIYNINDFKETINL